MNRLDTSQAARTEKPSVRAAGGRRHSAAMHPATKSIHRVKPGIPVSARTVTYQLWATIPIEDILDESPPAGAEDGVSQEDIDAG